MNARTLAALSVFVAIGAAAARSSAIEPPRRLTLADAVDLAMAVDPTVAESKIGKDRSKLAVLRAQLDRVSVKVDGSLQELWLKQNIGGPTQVSCVAYGMTFSTDPATCATYRGVASPTDQSPSGAQGLLNLTASVTVPLFTGFRVTSTVKRAQLAEDASGVAIRQARKDTALSVARAYWSVRRFDLRRDVLAAGLARLRESEAIIDGRVTAGLAPPIDLNRARVRRLQQEASIADANGMSREAVAQLAVTLGIGGDVVLVDEPIVSDAPPSPVEELLATARADRPEIKTARLQLLQQGQGVRIAKSTWYPQLSAFGLFQYGNNALQIGSGTRAINGSANPFSGLAGELTLGAQLSVNFFDTLNTWTATKDARYEEARLAEEQRRASRLVEGDVRSAHARIQHLSAMRAPLVAASDVARDNVTILEARYKNGDALVIEYIEAQLDLVSIESQLADLTAQLQVAWYELGAALGETVGVAGQPAESATSR